MVPLTAREDKGEVYGRDCILYVLSLIGGEIPMWKCLVVVGNGD